MKVKRCLVGLVVACLLIPQVAGASTVFETTGWITGSEGLTYEFIADTAPYTYTVTLSDLSEAPFFGFDFLYLSITTATDSVDSIVGPGSFLFAAIPGETYFANVFGTGGGDMGAGLFGIEITSVPIPPSLLLLGSSLLGMVWARRKVS